MAKKRHKYPKNQKGIGSPKPECLVCGCVRLGSGGDGFNYRTIDGRYSKYAPPCEIPNTVRFRVKLKDSEYREHIIRVYENNIGVHYITCADKGGVYYFKYYDIERIYE